MGIIFSTLLHFFGWRPGPPDQTEGILTRYIVQAPRFNLFAVVIGINKYAGCSTLRGAVADANAVNEYLQGELGIPKDHIHMLLDGQATRAAIIKAFRKLRDDRRIKKGDPILIFFAGHGSELCAPSAWHIEGLIQSILPSDYKKSSGWTGILPIPDRTLGALIDDIANEKGDNIIAIFDCCFAGGSTRVDEEEGYTPRTEVLDPNILIEVNDLDQDILEARHGTLPEIFSAQGHRSHVLLAASGETERAYEHEGRGLFTLALLKTLEENDISDITYVEITELIPDLKRHQSPRCVGFHKERIIFDVRVPGRRKVRYSARLDSTGSLVVNAGQAHGVSHGVEFTLYDRRGIKLGTVKVGRGAEVKKLYTKVTSEADDWRGAWSATLTRVGEVPFYLGRGWNSSPMAKKILQRLLGDRASGRNFQFVKDPREARLEIAVENDQVIFKILDERTKRFGLTRLPYTATLDSVDRILSAAAHYHWYLHTNNCSAANNKVDVDFYKLKEGLVDQDQEVNRVPDGLGLCWKDSVDGLDVVNFVVTPKTYYGVEIKNNTTRDLYLNVFLFNSDLSIAPCRIQSSRGNPEAPLKQKKSLTVGYGSSDERPFTYWLAKDQDVDVGYLKLFFATQPIDLTDIQQESPFFGSGKTAEVRLGAQVVEKVGDVQDVLFTKMIPIVQRRHGG